MLRLKGANDDQDKKFPPSRREFGGMSLFRLLAGAGTAFLFASVVYNVAMNPPHAKFDSSEWKADTSVCAFYFGGNRKGMAEDLQQRLMVLRPDRDEVAQLLGEPGYFQTESLWSYHAGTSTMDCLTFDVRFDGDGVLSEARLVQH